MGRLGRMGFYGEMIIRDGIFVYDIEEVICECSGCKVRKG